MVGNKTILVFFAVMVTSAVSVSDVCKGGARCIVVTQCTGLYNELEQQAARYILRRLHCGFYDSVTPMICCPPQFYSDSVMSKAFRDLDYSAYGTAELLPDYNTCGTLISDKVVGGTQTNIDEHPWMALLGYTTPRGVGFYCGGVLISSRYVLTAGHCARGSQIPSTWRLSQVRLGEWDTSTTLDCYGDECSAPPLDVPIEEVFTHEGYNPGSSHQHNDIALLRLSWEVPFSDFIKPICLPRSPELRSNTFEGYDMEVAGWGQTETDKTSDVKLKVRLPVVNNSYCAAKYRTIGKQITWNQLCAGALAAQDSCRGDSGGSLMGRVPNLENWMAVGIVSYGPSPCGSVGWPGIYTRVTAYMDWILSKMRP